MAIASSGTAHITWNPAAIQTMLATDSGIRGAVNGAADRLARRAESVYQSQQRGTTTLTDDRGISPGVLYERSFEVAPGNGSTGEVQVINTNPTSKWVESGAHARGVTPILAYRPMFSAIDSQTEGMHDGSAVGGGGFRSSLGSVSFSAGTFSGALASGASYL